MLKEPPDFSLVLGGPLYQLLRRARLTGDALQLVRRRVVVLVLLAWVPLLLFSLAAGHAWGESVAVPFLKDIDLHARFLLALPLLVVAELLVHERMRAVVREFFERDLIADSAREKFDAAIASAMRLRNSIPVEVFLIAFIYIVGVGIVWRAQSALDVASWYGAPVGGRLNPSPAGWWLGCVSLPIFQFLLLRWYFRLFIWARFLWQVSRIEMRILPTHPDRCGGLGFLAQVSHAFAPFLIAQGAVVAGTIANHIFFEGAQLLDFQAEIIGLAVLMLLVTLGPLLLFSSKLADVRREGMRTYGALAQRHAREFDDKWARGGAKSGELMVGSPDISSLADMDTVFESVKSMRTLPFTLHTVIQLAVTTLAPIAPLALTMVPLDELLKGALKILF